jgi:hypothetical protein
MTVILAGLIVARVAIIICLAALALIVFVRTRGRTA